MLLTRIKRRHKEYPEPSGSRLLAALYTRTKPYYAYDALGRPYSRDTEYPQKEEQHTAAFSYNPRSELTNAQLDEATYAYNYDNIGNRITAQEEAEEITYAANELNQYTQIDTNGDDFTPEYDANGNQTLVQTSTGIWRVTYNAENRAVKFESADGNTIIDCAYDYMGRRFEKKVTTNGTVTLRQRYLYRGYLQIACLDLTRANQPALWYITWDPTQPIATRPLAIQKDGTWFTYGWDLTKNICEIYGPSGFIRTTYTYTPYGSVTADGDVEQAIQWSSEYHDTELALVYYNYRYYNSTDGRWTRRDPIGIAGGINYYAFVNNYPYLAVDIIGLDLWSQIGKKCKRAFDSATKNMIKALLKKACGKGSGSPACVQAQQQLRDLVRTLCCNGGTSIDDTMPWSNNPPETNPNDKPASVGVDVTASASMGGVYGKVSVGVNSGTGVSNPKYGGGVGNRSGVDVNINVSAPFLGGQVGAGFGASSNGGFNASAGWGIRF